MISESMAVWMIAAAIVREAADQPTEGKKAVAQVVVTRSIEWKKPINKVLVPSQFPWVNFHIAMMPKAHNEIDKAVQKEALEIARAAYKGAKAKKLKKGKYLFFNTKPSGRKFNTEVPVVAIGAHYFY